MKNPIFWNDALAVAADGSEFSCNCVVNEAMGTALGYLHQGRYKLPEVVAYKEAMGLKGNGAGHIPLATHREDAFQVDAHRRLVRSIALLLAYESGAGSDLTTA